MPKYDLAVVGAGIGGLAAAALAAKRGKSTVVFEQNSACGGALESEKKEQYLFSPGPYLSFGFEREGAIHTLGESLGIALNATLQSPTYQVALPDRRVTIYAEHSETLEELRREFNREIDRIAKFYRDLRKQAIRGMKNRISNYLLRRKRSRGFLGRYGFSPEFTAFLDVQSAFFFRRRVAEISLYSLIAMCDASPYAVHDGFNKITEQLVETILKNNGEIYYEVPFSQITMRNGRTILISTPVGNSEVRNVLLNTEQRKQGSVFYLAIRNDVIPVSMLQTVICLPEYSRMDDMFSISLRGKEGDRVDPAGMSTLIASFPFQLALRSGDDCMRYLGSVIPFIRDFVLLSEEQGAVSRAFSLPKELRFKSLGRVDNHEALRRSSGGNIYILSDGSGAPDREIAAAQAFVDRLI